MKTATNEHIGVNHIRKIGNEGVFIKEFCDLTQRSIQNESHRDDYYMFGVILSGFVGLTVDFKNISLSSGEVMVTMPGQIHRVSSHDVDSAGYLIGIASEHLSDEERTLIDKHSLNPKPIRLENDECKDIKKLLEVLCHYQFLTLAKSIISIILLSMESSSEVLAGRYTSITLKFKALLNKYIDSVKRPSMYANMLNISEVYLNEAVKKTTGLSASKFIMIQVVIQAKRLFAHTSMNAKQVASQLGYIDYPYFSRLFKKIEGVSPTEYCKNLK